MSQQEFGSQSEIDVVQPDEAEKLIKLWAQRQAEAGQSSANPNVTDFAEALGTSPENVRTLLEEIRTPLLQKESSTTTNFHKRLKIRAAIAATMLILGIGVFLAQNQASSAAVSVAPTPKIAEATAAAPIPASTTNVSDAIYQAPREFQQGDLPENLKVVIDGVTIVGSTADYHYRGQSLFEKNVTDALTSAIRSYFPPSTESFADIEQIRRVSSESLRQQVANGTVLVKWIPVEATYFGESFRTTVPILLNEDSVIGPLVQAEQMRRLKKLANQIFFVNPSQGK